MASSNISPKLSTLLPTETNLHGPFTFFNNSFTIEFLRPDPARNASVLFKVIYKMIHPEVRLGKAYAQVPPLHLHFAQTESFFVLQGKVGTTTTYDMVDNVWTRENTRTPISVEPWVPHTFWPVVDEKEEEEEEAILCVWAHPTSSSPSQDFLFPPLLDHLFFASVLGHVSDAHEGKEKLDIIWIMCSQ